MLTTELILIGLKQLLAKMHSCFQNTTYSARNLGFIFDENFTFFDQKSALSKACYSQFVNFAAFVFTLIPKQPVSLQT